LIFIAAERPDQLRIVEYLLFEAFLLKLVVLLEIMAYLT
jgi:hypothetical protein